jgi:hypothetical protein
MNSPHKHATVIKAWADGATIECRSEARPAWAEMGAPGQDHQPRWCEDFEYRVKPAPTVRWIPLFRVPAGALTFGESKYSKENAVDVRINGQDSDEALVRVLKIAIDPDSGEVISAMSELP